MTAPKWGESFLKSGLPLEHLTAVTLRSLNWHTDPQYEYSRRNRENQEAWFEMDLVASCPDDNRSTELSLLVECKYHDLSRYWFFLPYDPSGRWCFDDRVLNCGPYSTLKEPRADTALSLAPISSGGIVVSKDGTKQDNSVRAAIEQLANGFVPYSLSYMFGYQLDFRNVWGADDAADFVPAATVLVPMIVTNASLYRLKPSVTNLDTIREAKSPAEVADEVEWTWHYYDVPHRLFRQNLDAIDEHVKEQAELVYHFPNVKEVIDDFADRPNWIAIVNISALSKVVTAIQNYFTAMETVEVRHIIHPRKHRKKKN
jgi:hypothetical protein